MQESTSPTLSCLSFSYYNNESSPGVGKTEHRLSTCSESEFEFSRRVSDKNPVYTISQLINLDLAQVQPVFVSSSPSRSSPSIGCCQKSLSTGSAFSSYAKKWTIRQLLGRSSSDGGKDFYRVVTPSRPIMDPSKALCKDSESVPNSSQKREVSPHVKFYVKAKGLKKDSKRRSYLPYRQDIVSLFASPNRLDS